MSIENSSWGQQSPTSWGHDAAPTIWDEQPSWRRAPAQAIPSAEHTADTVFAGSLVGEAGHLAVIASGTEVSGNTDPFVKSIN